MRGLQGSCKRKMCSSWVVCDFVQATRVCTKLYDYTDVTRVRFLNSFCVILVWAHGARTNIIHESYRTCDRGLSVSSIFEKPDDVIVVGWSFGRHWLLYRKQWSNYHRWRHFCRWKSLLCATSCFWWQRRYVVFLVFLSRYFDPYRQNWNFLLL